MELYKEIESQWFEKMLSSDHIDLKEIEYRMDIVYKLLTEEERKHLFFNAKKELTEQFEKSFEEVWNKKWKMNEII